MKSAGFALFLGFGLIVLGRDPGSPGSPGGPEAHGAAVRAQPAVTGGSLQPLYAGVDDHAASGTVSNVNGVLEPGETIQVSPFWMNTLGTPQSFTGGASNLAGPPGPLYSIVDGVADYGTVAGGATTDCDTATGNCYLITVSGVRPVAHWDVTFLEGLSLGGGTTWTVHVGDSFTDVLTTHPFYAYIEQLFHLQITTGCGAGLYCPSSPATRAQMAVFLLKSEHTSSYVPPGCTGIFGDVPCPSQYADWIEQLYNEGITGGCQASPLLYCPDNPVTRAQMAVFLLKTQHGSSYVPPGCTGIFADVPCPSLFANWIEQLYAEGITGGCQASPLLYCPDAPVTRGQMAVFLLRTFAPLQPPVPTPTAPPVTPTATSTVTPTPTPTRTGSMPPTSTFTPTQTPSVTLTPTITPSVTPTRTGSMPPTATFTKTATNTPTPSPTPTGHLVFVGQNGTLTFVDSISGTSTTTITAGETVTWVWQTGFHSTTSGQCTPNCVPDFNWDSGQHSTPFSFPHVFNTGNTTYPYYCSVHGGVMIGTVIVNPAPAPARSAR